MVKHQIHRNKKEYVWLLTVKMTTVCGLVLMISVGNMNFISIVDGMNSRLEYFNETAENQNIEDISVSFTNSNSLNNQGLYYYNSLSDDMKEVFKEMYHGVSSYSDKIKLSTPITEKQLTKLVYILQFDCPMLFNIDINYNYDEKNGKVIAFYPEYSMTKKEYAFKLEKVDNFVNDFTKSMSDMSDYEKQLYIHDYITSNTVYDVETTDNNNIYGCLINGQANCKGYSSAYIYLLRNVGIESAQVIGEIKQNGETIGHSWALNKIDGDYYYTDVCWDDIEGYNDISNDYVFFNMTYNEMISNRKLDKQYQYLGEIPESTATMYSYYKSKGLYAETYEDAYKIIKEKLPESLSSQNKSFVIQCKNGDVYNKLTNNITSIIEELISNGTISINYCKYSKIDNGYALIIHDFS